MPEMTRERLAEIRQRWTDPLREVGPPDVATLLATAEAALDVAEELDVTEELQTCMPNHAKMWADRLRGKECESAQPEPFKCPSCGGTKFGAKSVDPCNRKAGSIIYCETNRAKCQWQAVQK